jgi:hypothetical protein
LTLVLIQFAQRLSWIRVAFPKKDMASDCQIVNGIGFVPSTAKLELAAEAAPYVLSALLLWCDDDVSGVSSAGPIDQVQAFLDHAARTSKSHPLLTFAIASSTREREPSGPAAGMALQLRWMLRKPRAFLGEAIRSLSHCIAPEEPVYGWRASVVTSPFWCSVRIIDIDSGESAWTCTEQQAARRRRPAGLQSKSACF